MNLTVNNYTGAIQWWHNGTAITGSTAKYTLVPSSSTLQINNVEFSDAGIYQAELPDATPVRQFSIFDITVIGKCSEKQIPFCIFFLPQFNFRVFIHYEALKQHCSGPSATLKCMIHLKLHSYSSLLEVGGVCVIIMETVL